MPLQRRGRWRQTILQNSCAGSPAVCSSQEQNARSTELHTVIVSPILSPIQEHTLIRVTCLSNLIVIEPSPTHCLLSPKPQSLVLHTTTTPMPVHYCLRPVEDRGPSALSQLLSTEALKVYTYKRNPPRKVPSPAWLVKKTNHTSTKHSHPRGSGSIADGEAGRL